MASDANVSASQSLASAWERGFGWTTSDCSEGFTHSFLPRSSKGACVRTLHLFAIMNVI